MCGIVGAIAPAQVDRRLVEQMRDRLAHRGPDGAGLWSTADGRVCLGHRRLSIVDLTAAASQPFASADGLYVMTYNGELYNFRALRSELERGGSVFRTASDTEVLLEAYRAWDTACLGRLSGMFAFAIWDETRQELFCARDRAGEKPFYYALVDGAFVFASELKSLLVWPRFDRRVDYAALAEYLTFGAIPDPRTVWTGARKLPPGHLLRVRLEESGASVVERSSYWDFSFEQEAVDAAEWDERIRSTLAAAAGEMAYADVPVGTFLSGGIDSSSVTAALARAGTDVASFTTGFDEPSFDERPWAAVVARHVGARHMTSVVDAGDVEAVFRETILWHYDEPFNDYSYFPTYYVSRDARKHVTVALSGDGADEIFGGYPKYRLLALRSSMERVAGRQATQRAAAGARAVLPGGVRLRERLLRYEQEPAEVLIATLTTAFTADELAAAARGALAETLERHDPAGVVRRHLAAAPVEQVGLVNAMRYLDLKLTLGAGILTKVDRSSMAVALEVRPVYLHRAMLDLAGRIPARLLADRSDAKKVLRRAFRPWLPNEVLERPKQGFAMPLGAWLRGELRSRLALRVQNRPVAALYSADALRALADEHASGAADHTGKLHALFFLDEWLERWA